MKFETVRFHHFGIGTGRCTIAYQIDENRDADERYVRFACSFAAPNDDFSKRKGRAIAFGRLQKAIESGFNYKNSGEIYVTVDRTGESGNILFQILEGVRLAAYSMAPKWRNQIKVLVKNGKVSVQKGDVKYSFFNEDNEFEIEPEMQFV